ncbi:MAG: DJ-1/PfpI family protein [Deltaproteobacteria bacterium]|nr:DJ-1/PfpI family protein [Deltaproteobacteria bacterium]
MPNKPTKILLFLPQGFEDLEAVTTLDVFGWTQYRNHLPTVSVTTAGFHKVIKSRFGLTITPDLLYGEINPSDYRALVLPGGFHSHGFDEAYDARIHKLAAEIHENRGYIATMCVGILPIAEAGLLKGKKATTYPYSRYHDNVGRLRQAGAKVVNDNHVVMDDRIISCDGPGSSLEVIFLLMECLLGEEATKEVRSYMIYDQ